MISFGNAVGNLFNQLGAIGGLIKSMRAYQQTQLNGMTNTTNGVTAQFTNQPDIQAIMGDNYISQLNSYGTTLGTLCQQMAVETVNRAVFDDNPRINQTLTQDNTLASLQEIIRQMKVAGATVLQTTITTSPSAFTGEGNGTINSSVYRPSDGLMLENSYTESILFTCSSDSYSGGATAGNESFTLTGTGQDNSFFDFDWPLGSNAQTSLNAIDGSSDATNGNTLTNSDYQDWTNNVPDNWDLNAGAGGTNVFRESGITYDGDYCMKWTGDPGGTLVNLSQLFDDSSGTEGQLSPQVQYGYCIFLRRDGSPPLAGVLRISLVDENGTIVQDMNGVSNSFTIDLTALNLTFTAYKTQFRTPAIMPDSVYLQMELTTPLTNGRSVYMARSSLGTMTQLYVSGPYFAVHSGSTPFLQGDYGTCQVTNARGAGGTLNTMQTLVSTLLPDFYSNELLLPSSSTPTVSDTLIL